eukprot:PhM_4_TR4609/c0_g1_i1/m.39127
MGLVLLHRLAAHERLLLHVDAKEVFRNALELRHACPKRDRLCAVCLADASAGRAAEGHRHRAARRGHCRGSSRSGLGRAPVLGDVALEVGELALRGDAGLVRDVALSECARQVVLLRVRSFLWADDAAVETGHGGDLACHRQAARGAVVPRGTGEEVLVRDFEGREVGERLVQGVQVPMRLGVGAALEQLGHVLDRQRAETRHGVLQNADVRELLHGVARQHEVLQLREAGQAWQQTLEGVQQVAVEVQHAQAQRRSLRHRGEAREAVGLGVQLLEGRHLLPHQLHQRCPRDLRVIENEHFEVTEGLRRHPGGEEILGVDLGPRELTVLGDVEREGAGQLGDDLAELGPVGHTRVADVELLDAGAHGGDLTRSVFVCLGDVLTAQGDEREALEVALLALDLLHADELPPLAAVALVVAGADGEVLVGGFFDVGAIATGYRGNKVSFEFS